ncbi:MAG: hypothetical protein Q9201_007287, partial [Fulgogasparrea decipioides]
MSSQDPQQPPLNPKTEPDTEPITSNPNATDQDQTFDPSSLDADIDMNIGPSPYENSTTIPGNDGPADDPNPNPEGAEEEVKLPMQKDITLQEFLSKMDDYAPI